MSRLKLHKKRPSWGYRFAQTCTKNSPPFSLGATPTPARTSQPWHTPGGTRANHWPNHLADIHSPGPISSSSFTISKSNPVRNLGAAGQGSSGRRESNPRPAEPPRSASSAIVERYDLPSSRSARRCTHVAHLRTTCPIAVQHSGRAARPGALAFSRSTCVGLARASAQ